MLIPGFWHSTTSGKLRNIYARPEAGADPLFVCYFTYSTPPHSGQMSTIQQLRNNTVAQETFPLRLLGLHKKKPHNFLQLTARLSMIFLASAPHPQIKKSWHKNCSPLRQPDSSANLFFLENSSTTPDSTMNNMLARFLLLSLFALPVHAELKPGELAPQFTTAASFAGKEFNYSLKDSLQKGPVVVYFYPTAFGGGCSIQARAFSQSYEKFAAAGASIVGVSLDDIGRLNEFSAHPDFCASKFPVASDTSGKIAGDFGLSINEKTRGRKDNRGITVDHGSIDRTTFIVGSDGKIIATLGGFAAAENVEQSLLAVQKIAAAN